MNIVRQILGAVQRFLVRYVVTVICAIICIVMLVISSGIRGSSKTDLAAAERELGDIRNKIDQYNVSMQNKQDVVLVTEDGKSIDYDEVRYKRDVTNIAKFLSQAFQFSDANEYIAKRTSFHKMICPEAIAESNRGQQIHDPEDCAHQHEIFKYLLTPYNPEWKKTMSERLSGNVDGMVFSSKVTKITPYITQINSNKTVETEHDDTAIYSYMLDVTLAAQVPQTYHGDYILVSEGTKNDVFDGELPLIVTCDVQSNGSITNFHVVTYEANDVFARRSGLISSEDIREHLKDMHDDE